MIRLSTGLRNALMGSSGLRAMMNYGVIDVYSGTAPAVADMVPTGTRLARITQNGLPFVAGSLPGGLITKKGMTGQLINDGTWVMTGLATGAAGWWRWKWNVHDPDTFSLFYPRVDGLVNETLVLLDTAVSPGSTTTIDSFTMVLRG